MSKKTLGLLTLAFFLNFVFSCTTISTTSKEVKISPSTEIEAKIFPEVKLKTTSGDIHNGKLISLRGRNLRLMPFPYWNVESININLEDIYSIRMLKKVNRAGKGAAGGFAWTFLVFGILSGITSEYDEDYEAALLGSSVLGALGGLVGFAIGGISDVASKSEYKFYEMTDSEKLTAIKKIMGR